jgi:transposase-like protein
MSGDELRSQYEAGVTVKELARIHGVHYATMRRRLVAAGCDIRPTRRTEVDLAEIRRLADMGLSQKQRADALGSSQVTISRRMRRELDIRRGLPWRKRERDGADHTRWKGGRRLNGKYVEIWLPPNHPMRVMANAVGYTAEHRLVLAVHLGRPLERWETVHHINGDPTDNRVENLQLRQGKHGKGVVYACADCGSANVVQRPIK